MDMSSAARMFPSLILFKISSPINFFFLVGCRPGATVLVLGLPVLIYVFPFLCNDISGCPAPSLLSPSSFSLEKLKVEVGWPENGIRGFYSTEATLYVLGYYLLSLVLQVFLPGREPEGVVLACGSRHKYKFNCMVSETTLCVWCIG